MIWESIVTTKSPDGRTHIAPMGYQRIDGLYRLQPFKPSTSWEFMRASKTATINTTDDVRIYAGCIVGKRDWPLVPCDATPGMRLADPLWHVELELVREEADEQRPRLYFAPKHDVNHRPFMGFNRAQAAVIEAAILVSRLHMLPADKIDREIAYLTIAIEKTADAASHEAWQWLVQRIGAYRAGNAAKTIAA